MKVRSMFGYPQNKMATQQLQQAIAQQQQQKFANKQQMQLTSP
jgi:hypothetical protein